MEGKARRGSERQARARFWRLGRKHLWFLLYSISPLPPSHAVSCAWGKPSRIHYGCAGGTVGKAAFLKGVPWPKLRPTEQIPLCPRLIPQQRDPRRRSWQRIPRNLELLWLVAFLSLCSNLFFKSVGYPIFLQYIPFFTAATVLVSIPCHQRPLTITGLIS